MSLFDKAFNAYRSAALAKGCKSDADVVERWLRNPEEYFPLYGLRMKAIELCQLELGY